MHGGDISNLVQGRYVFVWENLLASLDPELAPKEDRLVRRHKWAKALDLWVLEEYAEHVLHDLTWRKSFPVDILCTHPAPFAEKLEEELNNYNYPFSRMYCSPLLEFGILLNHLPEVIYVVHPDNTHPLLFGSRGRCLSTESLGSIA